MTEAALVPAAPDAVAVADGRDLILSAVAFAAERFLRGGAWHEQVDEVLARLGMATGSSRVYVFRVRDVDGVMLADQRHEWAAPGVRPEIDNADLQDLPLVEAGFGRWAEILGAGGVVHGLVAGFPASEKALLEAQGILSIVVVPVVVDGRWWGFVGFDATESARTWTTTEVDALRAAAGVLGASIQQHRTNAALHEAAERLRAADALKDTFLTAVSHELRTPLTAINGFVSTLSGHGERLDPEARALLFDRLQHNVARLDGLLSELLDLNRLHEGDFRAEPVDTDLASLLRRAVLDCPLLGDRPVTLDVQAERATVDPGLVGRILDNLLQNAGRHTPHTCNVWVRALPGPRSDEVLLVVEDDGDGVPQSLRDAVFEPFRHGASVPSHAPGIGVGLSLVARFAVLHGGQAWVDERPGGGASFRVLLRTAA